MSGELKNQRVAILATDGFEQSKLTQPLEMSRPPGNKTFSDAVEDPAASRLPPPRSSRRARDGSQSEGWVLAQLERRD
jgi:hypothetical protein